MVIPGGRISQSVMQVSQATSSEGILDALKEKVDDVGFDEAVEQSDAIGSLIQ